MRPRSWSPLPSPMPIIPLNLAGWQNKWRRDLRPKSSLGWHIYTAVTVCISLRSACRHQHWRPHTANQWIHEYQANHTHTHTHTQPMQSKRIYIIRLQTWRRPLRSADIHETRRESLRAHDKPRRRENSVCLPLSLSLSLCTWASNRVQNVGTRINV